MRGGAVNTVEKKKERRNRLKNYFGDFFLTSGPITRTAEFRSKANIKREFDKCRDELEAFCTGDITFEGEKGRISE